MKSVSAPVIDYKIMKPSKSEIPQIVRYPVKFLSLQNFYSTKILQSLESEVNRIAAHSSVCRSLWTIPYFVGLFTSNKSYNLRNIGIIWYWPVPQCGRYQSKFPVLLVFVVMKACNLRNQSFIALQIWKKIPYFTLPRFRTRIAGFSIFGL